MVILERARGAQAMSSRQPRCVAGTRGGCREKKACTANSAREAWHSPSNIVVATPYEG